MKNMVNELGGDIIYIQKWPWLFDNDYPWWKFINRPEVSLNEFQLLEKKSVNAESVAMVTGIYGKSIASENEQMKNIYIAAVTYNYPSISEMKLEQGRFFSEYEMITASPKIILGHKIAENLFPGENPVGKTVKILNKKYQVIGVLQKKGGSLSFDDTDNLVIIPIENARYLFGANFKNLDATIKVKSKSDVKFDDFESEIRGIMRSIRRLKPSDEDNFALNRASFISDKLNDIFLSLSIMGWIIAAFSILVGGFGTANIMFVSVKERTFLIGIEKALGAPRYFILTQFLGESVILCLVGGIIGILLVVILIFVANQIQDDIRLYLSLNNILIGVGLSTFIGIVAGFIPAYQAAKLDPIEAIRNVF